MGKLSNGLTVSDMVKASLKGVLIGIVGWVIVFTTVNLFESRNNVNNHDKYLEIYSALDIYYVNVDKLEIQTEGSDSVFFFKTFDDLGFWLSEKTEEDAVDALNIAAYQEYVRCSNQALSNYNQEWRCYVEYINKLVVIE